MRGFVRNVKLDELSLLRPRERMQRERVSSERKERDLLKVLSRKVRAKERAARRGFGIATYQCPRVLKRFRPGKFPVRLLQERDLRQLRLLSPIQMTWIGRNHRDLLNQSEIRLPYGGRHDARVRLFSRNPAAVIYIWSAVVLMFLLLLSISLGAYSTIGVVRPWLQFRFLLFAESVC